MLAQAFAALAGEFVNLGEHVVPLGRPRRIGRNVSRSQSCRPPPLGPAPLQDPGCGPPVLLRRLGDQGDQPLLARRLLRLLGRERLRLRRDRRPRARPCSGRCRTCGLGGKGRASARSSRSGGRARPSSESGYARAVSDESQEIVQWPLEGRAAEEFRDAFLVQAGDADENWSIPYLHRETGERFVMSYPDAEHHGGGTPRLRPVDS